ncbi:MAG: hypothetical protein ACPGVG_19700, partial [Mycobacterium sp.]
TEPDDLTLFEFEEPSRRDIESMQRLASQMGDEDPGGKLYQQFVDMCMGYLRGWSGLVDANGDEVPFPASGAQDRIHPTDQGRLAVQVANLGQLTATEKN